MSEKIVQVYVTRCHPDAIIPQVQTRGSAGLDFATVEEVTIPPGEVRRMPTGIRVAIPYGHVGLIFERSSFNLKTGCSLSNKVGVIDSDYRGEVLMSVRNGSTGPVTIPKGERVGQLVILPYLPVEIVEVAALNETERGAGGFGSTG